MPTYVYKFIDTGETIEVQQSFHEPTLTEVPHPSDGQPRPVRKVFTPIGVTFKGNGFYKTDNRSSKNGSKDSSSKASKDSDSSSKGDGASSSKSDGSSSKSDTGKGSTASSSTGSSGSTGSSSAGSSSSGSSSSHSH
jgi:predicted nucleic acid-binding Zn ribbon protein